MIEVRTNSIVKYILYYPNETNEFLTHYYVWIWPFIILFEFVFRFIILDTILHWTQKYTKHFQALNSNCQKAVNKNSRMMKETSIEYDEKITYTFCTCLRDVNAQIVEIHEYTKFMNTIRFVPFACVCVYFFGGVKPTKNGTVHTIRAIILLDCLKAPMTKMRLKC